MIFLFSVFYAAITYEDVFDLAKIEETMETVDNCFDESAFTKWKNEYAHPLVVGHSRRREASQVRKVHEINTNSEISRIDGAIKSGSSGANQERVRNTKLFELSDYPNKRGGNPKERGPYNPIAEEPE
jgi:hypothetical protein